MYQLKRILIGLDFSAMDAHLLKYASMLANKIHPEAIYLFSVGKKMQLPDSLQDKYGDEEGEIEDILIREQQSRARKYLKTPQGTEIHFNIEVGKAHEKIRGWIAIKEIDLIVVGRKATKKGSGKLVSSITRSSHCSVLVVPEDPPTKLETLLIPVNVDNKENLPIVEALELMKEASFRLFIQSIYEVPTGYHYSGKSFSEFAEVMEDNQKAKMEVIKKRYDLAHQPVEYVYSLDEDHNLAAKIYEVALKENVDMILMGSKGRTRTASLFLSSIAEKVSLYDKLVPLLVVKDKQKNLGFLDALKQL